MKHIKFLKKFDIFIIILLLFFSFTPLFIFNFSSTKNLKEKFAVIKINGEFKERFNLTEDRTFHIPTAHGTNTLSIIDGVVSMIDANCNDKLCVNSNGISNVYQTIICLPHNLIIEIEGEMEKSSDDMIFSH